jgi:hypothetical protein
MKNWGVIGGIAAALAAGIYVIWGPITERKKRRKGRDGALHRGLGFDLSLSCLFEWLALLALKRGPWSTK